ncbi:15777_t:CDS:1, partial [Racocetra persica]
AVIYFLRSIEEHLPTIVEDLKKASWNLTTTDEPTKTLIINALFQAINESILSED